METVNEAPPRNDTPFPTGDMQFSFDKTQEPFLEPVPEIEPVAETYVAHIDPLVLEIYNKVKTSWSLELNTNTIALLVPVVISTIEKNTKGIDGSYKKSIAISIMKFVVKESNLDSETKQYLDKFIDFTAPVLIDTMIKIANKEIDLGKVMTESKGCFCLT